MKIVVTGSNGSVGKRVVLAALRHGYSVVGIDVAEHPNIAEDSDVIKPDFEEHFLYVKTDLHDFEETLKVLRESGCDGIVHLAGIRSPGDYLVTTHNSNVVLSWNVLRAAAELGITRVALASSVNVVTLVYSKVRKLEYFPIDEDHPCHPDEPYGLSKVIAELQADTIVRRYPNIRIASLRLHWSVPSRAYVQSAKSDREQAGYDLWGYVQQDSAAGAFLLALTAKEGAWNGHESFFICAPEILYDDVTSMQLRDQYYGEVPIKEGEDLSGKKGFFDCGKAERILGWKHTEV